MTAWPLHEHWSPCEWAGICRSGQLYRPSTRARGTLTWSLSCHRSCPWLCLRWCCWCGRGTVLPRSSKWILLPSWHRPSCQGRDHYPTCCCCWVCWEIYWMHDWGAVENWLPKTFRCDMKLSVLSQYVDTYNLALHSLTTIFPKTIEHFIWFTKLHSEGILIMKIQNGMI